MRTIIVALALLAPALTTSLVAPVQAQEEDRVERRLERYIKRLDERSGRDYWNVVLQVEALGQPAKPKLRAMLDERDKLSEKVQLGLAKALSTLDEEYEFDVQYDTLLELVQKSKDEWVRLTATDLLGKIGDEELREPLTKLMNDTFDTTLRVALAKALYTATGSIAGRTALKSLLKSDDVRVQYEAALALAELEEIEAAKLVLLKLQDEPTPRGRLARAYLRQNQLIRDAEKLVGLGHSPKPTNGGGSAKGDPLLDELIEMVQKYHVDGGNYTRERLIALAAKGIAAGLDRHTAYWTPDEYREFLRQVTGEYAGIGVVVGYRGTFFTVVSPIYSGPAYRAGIRSRDAIIAVDGWKTRGKPTNEIISKIKGAPDTPVKLTIRRRGWEKDRDVIVMRRNIELPSVYTDLLPGKIGYARLTQFGSKTVKELNASLQQMKTQGMKAVIIDLRDNGGGWMKAAQDVADMFLPDNTLIVYSKGRSEVLAKKRELYASENTLIPKLPVYVLVDGGSASASEIVAGALKVHGRAKLIGERTFGKGTVQQPLQLESRKDARFKLTIARYYLPNDKSIDTIRDANGKLIQRGGIVPDIVIAQRASRAGWIEEELAKLWEQRKLRDYVAKHYADNKELFAKLAVNDGRDSTRYPGFDAWYEGLETMAGKQHVRELIRDLIREKVADDRGKKFVHDLLEDRQLQRAIVEACRATATPVESIPEFGSFADAFSKDDAQDGATEKDDDDDE